MASFNALMTFLSHHKNYQVYRSKLLTCEPPLVPFIAIHLSDLTFIDENEDKRARHKNEGSEIKEGEEKTPNGEATTGDKPQGQVDEELLINFYKMELLSKVLNQLLQFQKVTFDRYQPANYLQKYFGGVEAEEHEKMNTLTEKEIYELSLQVEPKVLRLLRYPKL